MKDNMTQLVCFPREIVISTYFIDKWSEEKQADKALLLSTVNSGMKHHIILAALVTETNSKN